MSRRKQTEDREARVETRRIERNAERRKKYAEDRPHREHLQTYYRRSYRDRVGMRTPRQRDKGGIRKNATTKAVRLPHLHNKPAGKRLVVTVDTVAYVLNRTKEAVQRWINKGMWPAPVLELADGSARVYTVREAREMVEIFQDHSRRSTLFRRDHTATIGKLFARVEEIRREELDV